MNGPEWVLYYTTSGFKDNLLTWFTLTNHVIFSTFAKCLQGKSKTAWEELLNEEFPLETDQTTADFDTVVMWYFEKVACVENLKDFFVAGSRLGRSLLIWIQGITSRGANNRIVTPK